MFPMSERVIRYSDEFQIRLRAIIRCHRSRQFYALFAQHFHRHRRRNNPWLNHKCVDRVPPALFCENTRKREIRLFRRNVESVLRKLEFEVNGGNVQNALLFLGGLRLLEGEESL